MKEVPGSKFPTWQNLASCRWRSIRRDAVLTLCLLISTTTSDASPTITHHEDLVMVTNYSRSPSHTIAKSKRFSTDNAASAP